MTWQTDRLMYHFRGMEPHPSTNSIPSNEQCYIRKDHKCGKLFGASKSCFIACPTEDDLEPILELISEKLSKVGVEPIIAVKERAYGQDIFCTKICGKIIEARFCIVILDDSVIEGRNIPNPNVYYEYGLMTSLRKHIIPLQKEDLSLAFNIQSYDTIKYSTRNIAGELDRAIKDALRITEAKEEEDKKTSITNKALLRRLELSGLELRDHGWFLADTIGDTLFKGFGQYDQRFYAYLGKIDEESEFQDHLDDLGVVLYRTEKKIEELEKKLSAATKLRDELNAEQEKVKEQDKDTTAISLINSQFMLSGRELANVNRDITDAVSKLELASTIYIGFVVNPAIETDGFVSEAQSLIDEYKRYILSYNKDNIIAFGDTRIDICGSVH